MRYALGGLILVIGALSAGIAVAQNSTSDASRTEVAYGAIPPAKAKLLQSDAAGVHHAVRVPKPTSTAVPQRRASAVVAKPAAPYGGRMVGILGLRQAPFSSAEFQVTNLYAGPFGTKFVYVYAGVAGPHAGSPRTAAVRVIETDLIEYANAVAMGTFPVSPPATGVRVTSISGSVLSLVTSSAAVVKFDLSTMSFL